MNARSRGRAERPAAWRRTGRAWLYLTPAERLALGLVLGLFLLGLGARAWHAARADSTVLPPPDGALPAPSDGAPGGA